MAGNNQSLKDWKTYYKKRYKKTGNKKYKQKLKELEEQHTSKYTFEYDDTFIKSRTILGRAEELVERWEGLTNEQIRLKKNKTNITKFLNNSVYGNMRVTSISVDPQGRVSNLHSRTNIHFENNFTLTRYPDGSWELFDDSVDF